MTPLTKIKILFQIRSLIIFSIIAGIIKLTEQIIKGKYFHDLDVYNKAIKLLNNYGNPYLTSWDLPYLYPPLISNSISKFNSEIFSIIYLTIYISSICLIYFFSNKKLRISYLISVGISGILIKSLMTGNISNIFYILVIFSIIFYSKYKSFFPYYITVFIISLIKFNFIILFLLPLILNENFKKEFINFLIFVCLILAAYLYQYKFMYDDFYYFLDVLINNNTNDHGSSLFSFFYYKLNINIYLSILFHSSIFIFLLGFAFINKKKIDKNFYLLLIITILVFANPRLKLYDVAFGIIFLNISILYFPKKIILNFYIFNLYLVLIFKIVSKNFELNLENPKLLVWYIFTLFFYYFLKKHSKLKFS